MLATARAGDPASDGQFDLVSSVYVLCYAATRGELAGFFTTARRSLSPAGKRLVAMTLDAGYSREPDYYSPYGISFTRPRRARAARSFWTFRHPPGRST